MSVCIASITDQGRAIVIATDQMLSMDGGALSSDHAVVKADFIGMAWMAMWAGDNITPIPDIMRRTHERLKPIGSQSHWTGSAVAQALSAAYQDEERHRAAAMYLSILGLDMETFLSDGLAMLGEAGFSFKLQEIQSFDLNITFLVCGFHGVSPSIFTVSQRGIVDHYTKPGFWAIGSGSSLARGSLAIRQHNSTRTIPESIYAVCEAKFAAELAQGVGRQTTLGMLAFDSRIRLMNGDEVERIRDAWKRAARPLIPDDAVKPILDWVKEPDLARMRQAGQSDQRLPKPDLQDKSPSPE